MQMKFQNKTYRVNTDDLNINIIIGIKQASKYGFWSTL